MTGVVISVRECEDQIQETGADVLRKVAGMDIQSELEGVPIHALAVAVVVEKGVADDLFADVALGSLLPVASRDCHEVWESSHFDPVNTVADLVDCAVVELIRENGLLDVMVVDNLFTI